jgi:hypothetical protein
MMVFGARARPTGLAASNAIWPGRSCFDDQDSADPRTTVSFSSPFTLRNVEGVQPAGKYVVLTDDESIEGLSKSAYRRVVTLFQTPAICGPQRHIQLVSISQTDLDAALMKDQNETVVMH